MKADIVVIGAGHNALVAAAYLAKAGRKPLVLEGRAVVGGAAVTGEIHPGFKAPTLAHTTGPLRASVVRDLGLAIETAEPEPRVFAPHPDGRGLSLWGDPGKTAAGLASWSPRDAERWPHFHRSLGRVSSVLARVLEMTPPDPGAPGLGDALPVLRVALGLRALGRVEAQNVLRWGPMAVADFAAEWFETDLLRAVIASRGITGTFAGPWSAGTTAHLLLGAAAAGGNGAGSTVLVKGGLGALSEALAAAARRLGAEIRTSAQVERITVRDGHATGVVLEGGEEIEAGVVVSGAHPQTTFLRLLDPALLDPEDVEAFRNYQSRGMAGKVNLALARLPRFTAVPEGEAADTLRGRIHVGPGIESLERAFDDAKYGQISRRPYLDITVPTLTDPGLAPAGAHVMSIYFQYAPYALREGDWETRRADLLESALRTLEAYAPTIRGDIVGSQVITPADMESVYGLVGGHPLHGEPSLHQIFTMRPVLGLARYRGPIAGLYLCGAGAHPGGGVTGGPGANAAREVLKDA
jgi:phytoene dehydrogenase-like protein